MSVASPSAPANRRTVHSDLLGDIRITDTQLLEFPEGLLGFPECRSWVFIEGAKPGTAWLQSAEHAALTFLVVDPFLFFDGYTVDLGPVELRRLGASEPTDVAVFSIVTLPATAQDDCMVNLQGPLVIHVHARRAYQVVLGDDRFGVRAPLPVSRLG